MNVDDLTLGQIKEIQTMCGSKSNIDPHPYKIGQAYLIRTVTMIYTGRVVEVYKNELVIEEAAWIADTGRWHQACTEGKLNEVEPYAKGDNVIIGRGAILDVSTWHKDLPGEQK